MFSPKWEILFSRNAMKAFLIWSGIIGGLALTSFLLRLAALDAGLAVTLIILFTGVGFTIFVCKR